MTPAAQYRHFRIADREIALSTSVSEIDRLISRFLKPYRIPKPQNAQEQDASIRIEKKPITRAGSKTQGLVRISLHQRWGPPKTHSEIIPLHFHPKIIYLGYLEPLLHLILRRMAVHPLHGIILFRRITGILICGPTRTGKTTTALHLTGKGWEFLNDDESYLVLRNRRAHAWGVPGPLYVRSDAGRRYTRLVHAQRGVKIRRGRENRWLIRDSSSSRSRYLPLRYLLFPEVRPKELTRLVLLDNRQALFRLLSQTSRGCQGMAKDPLSVSRAYAVMAQAARQSKSALLIWGRKPETTGEMLDRFLKNG